jgi:hypothetical protein
MKKLLLTLSIFAVLTSCETDVTDKVKTDAYNSAAAMSISGAITDLAGTGTYVDLQMSNPYLETAGYVKIENAAVQVFDGDSLLGTLTEVSPGRYEEVSILAIPGHQYRLEVEVPAAYGAAAGWWESTLDLCNEPFTLLAPFFPIMEGDSTYYDYRLKDTVYYGDADSAYYSAYQFWNDPAGKGNAYWVKSYATTKIYAPNGLQGPFYPQPTEVSLPSEINIYNDDQYIQGPQIQRMNFIGPPYTVYSDTLINLTFETRTVSPQLYDYLTIMATNVGGGGLFSVPYSPQIGNIRRMDDTTVYGLGYFYATSVRYDSITLFHPY